MRDSISLVEKYLVAFRVKEIIGKTGFFLIGIIFSRPEISVNNFLISVNFFWLCILNGLAVYVINAAFGYKLDQVNARLSNVQRVSRPALWIWSVVLTILALGALYFFLPRVVIPMVMVYVIWTLYSMPGGLKGIPGAGLLSAFAAQLVHFHVGYLVFSEPDLQSILLAIYFGLLFAAGHALHEVIDFEADKKAGVNTSAVFFGRKELFIFANYLFTAGAVYLIILRWFDVLSWYIVIPYLTAYAAQLLLLYRLPPAYDIDHLLLFRRRYMTVYVAATALVAMMLYRDILSAV